MTDPSASQRLAEKKMTNDEKTDGAALLPGDALASPPTTEALPSTWCERCQSWRFDPYCGREDCPTPGPSDYGSSLKAAIERDAVVVRIGIQTIAHACTYSDWANRWSDECDDYIREFAITDVKQFAKDIINEMLNEREDGSTPLSDFLDKVTEEAVNQGSLGLDVEDHKIKHGETSPLETWAKIGSGTVIASEWRPIETAPNGTPVLLWKGNTSEHYVAARVSGAHGLGWCTPDGHEIFKATHWMPLPPAPQVGSGNQAANAEPLATTRRSAAK